MSKLKNLIMKKESLKIAFAGSHKLSWFCLKEIAELCKKNDDQLKIVFNVNNKIGKKYSSFYDFTNLSKEYNFDYKEIASLEDEEIKALIRSLHIDIFFIIGWHRIVSEDVINTAEFCLGMHTSLLPKDRGSSPVNWQIIRGNKRGGITMFHLTKGVDDGDINSQKEFIINESDNCEDIHNRSIVSAILILRDTWHEFKTKKISRRKQIDALSTTNERRKASDGKISWNNKSILIDRQIRALTHPYPGAFTYLFGKKLFIWEAFIFRENLLEEHIIGKIFAHKKNILVSTEDGYLSLLKLNFESEPFCNAEMFLTAYNIKEGFSLL